MTDPAITWVETLNTATGLYDCAFTESVMDQFDFTTAPNLPGEPALASGLAKWFRIEGGTDALTRGLVDLVKRADAPGPGGPARIEQAQRVCAIRAAPPGEPLTVRIAASDDGARAAHDVHADDVILTPTLGMLRTWDWSACPLPGEKATAIRALHYDDSVKVAIKFGTRWWEDKAGIVGGTVSTDGPLRTIVFPSLHGKPGLSAVLMTSYSWSQDARRMGAVAGPNRAFARPAPGGPPLPAPDSMLVEFILRGLRDVFGEGVVPTGAADGWQELATWNWSSDPLSLGTFALFGPGQFMSTYDALTRPELNGRLHFAGEASSVHHAWIAGALASAYRAVDEVLAKSGTPAQRQQLRWWGAVADDADAVPGGDSATAAGGPAAHALMAPGVGGAAAAAAADTLGLTAAELAAMQSHGVRGFSKYA